MDNVIKFVPRAEAARDARPPRKRRTTPASGRSSGGGYLKAGDKLVCKVSHAEPGGYVMTIPKFGLRGFLPTDFKLKPGEEVFAVYVCISNGRILLGSRLRKKSDTTSRPQSGVDWKKKLEELERISPETTDSP